MSVINKMLKDLDERQESTDVNPASQYSQSGQNNSPQNQKNNTTVYLLAGILVVLLAIGWHLIFNSNNSDSTVAENHQGGLTTESDSDSNDPAAELQPVPDPALELQASPKPEEELGKAEEVAATEQSTDVPLSEASLIEETRAEVSSAKPTPESVSTSAKAGSPKDNMNPVITDTPDVQKNDSPSVAETDEKQAVQDEQRLRSQQSNAGFVKPTKSEPVFSIQKTTAQLTPEQHVQKLMNKAEDAYDKGYITEAIEQLTKVLAISDSHVEARNLLAAAWYGRGEAARAITIINDGLQRYPMIEEWRLTAAKIFFKENNSSGAFSYLDIDLANASKEFYTLKGNLARELKDFAKAEQAYQQLTAMESHVGSWWLGLAIAQDSQNKAADALASYKKVIMTGGVSRQSIEFSQQRIAELEG